MYGLAVDGSIELWASRKVHVTIGPVIGCMTLADCWGRRRSGNLDPDSIAIWMHVMGLA